MAIIIYLDINEGQDFGPGLYKFIIQTFHLQNHTFNFVVFRVVRYGSFALLIIKNGIETASKVAKEKYVYMTTKPFH